MDPLVDGTISPREQDVLAGLGDHLTNAEIGQRLHISVRTVESHVSSLMRKLSAADRRELATRAVEMTTPASQQTQPVLGLPSTWSSFVGRTVELAELAQALETERLVTLVGPGGIGKTRLAVAAARQTEALFPAGGAFVDLVPVSQEFIVEAVATALGQRELSGEPLTETVHARLREGRSLLILDNCEHVLADVVAFTRSLLAACPQAVVLATTRERFALAGAREVRIAPLALAGDTDGEASDARQLFIDRAGTAVDERSDLASIDEVCRRVEGMPLAIELAAARMDSLGLDDLLAGLEDHLRLLIQPSASNDRHGSLRSVIGWSHGLLNDEERTMFRRLGVFAGTFDLAAASMVAGDSNVTVTTDLLGRLTDKSLLVRWRQSSSSRWRMLDSVRSFARSELDASEETTVIRDRHLEWALDTAHDLEDSLDRDSDNWVTDYDLVIDDLRGATAEATDPGTNQIARFDLALALGHLCYARRFLAEGRDHLDAALVLAPDEARAVVVLRAAARAAFAELRGEEAFELLKSASTRAAAAGDARMAAMTLAEASSIAGRAPALFGVPLSSDQILAIRGQAEDMAPADDPEVEVYLALAAAWHSCHADLNLAQRALTLARQYGDPLLTTNALDAVSSALLDGGSFKEASGVTKERLVLLDDLPRHDPRFGGEVADTFHMAKETAIGTGDLQSALASAKRAFDDSTREGLPHFAAADLALPLALQGSFDETLQHALVMRDGWERAGRPAAGWLSPSFFAVALVHGLRAADGEYKEWSELALQVRGASTGGPFGFYVATRVALHRGWIEVLQTPDVVDSRSSSPSYGPYVQAMSAEVAVVLGASDASDLLSAAQPLERENDFAAAQLRRAAGRLHGDQGELEEAVAMWEAIGARFERAYTLTLIAERADEGALEFQALGCSTGASI